MRHGGKTTGRGGRPRLKPYEDKYISKYLQPQFLHLENGDGDRALPSGEGISSTRADT